jgi:outer membrane protein TolC
MGSSSYSKSTNVATDNRLAVTDQAFGLSSSGTGNNVTANGNIFNLATGGVGKSGGTGSNSAGGAISLSILDGGAVGRSLDFAENSLSMVLAGVLDAQKLQAQAVNQQADKVAGALAQAAQVQADSQASTLDWIQGNAKILAGGGLLMLAAWYLFIRKGRK